MVWLFECHSDGHWKKQEWLAYLHGRREDENVDSDGEKEQSVFLSDETYSAGIAVDDIEIFGCALPARQVIVQAVVTILNIKILFW